MFGRLSPELQENIPEDDYCEKHLELTLLFCQDDQLTMCDACFSSEDHKTHMVYGIKEAAEDYRKLFCELSNILKEKLEVTETLLAEEQEKMVIIQGEEQDFREVIESEYKMIFRLMTEESDANLEGPMFNLNLRKATSTEKAVFVAELEDKFQDTLQAVKRAVKKMVELAKERNRWLVNSNEQVPLQKLSALGKENMQKLRESEIRLYEQIYVLRLAIAELERKCGEAPVALLTDVQDCFERNSAPALLQSLEPAQVTDPRLCQIPGIRKILQVLQRPVTLDPTTAHSCLLLSEDLRSVRFRNVQPSVPGSPERLDYSASVLGVESFTSGRHYWEVDVEKATKWQLGVYEDTASGPDIMLKASGDKYLLMASMMEAECIFWVFPPLKRVSSGERIHKVGVFLDYSYGQIAFYDVTKGLLIYNFSHLAFHGALKPLFSLCYPNGATDTGSLTVCLPEADSCGDGGVDPEPSQV